jgi:hypothetical protein
VPSPAAPSPSRLLPQYASVPLPSLFQSSSITFLRARGGSWRPCPSALGHGGRPWSHPQLPHAVRVAAAVRPRSSPQRGARPRRILHFSGRRSSLSTTAALFPYLASSSSGPACCPSAHTRPSSILAPVRRFPSFRGSWPLLLDFSGARNLPARSPHQWSPRHVF